MKLMDRYRLILRHDMIFGKDICEVEEPIVIEYCADRERSYGGAIIVNDMIERLKAYMLDKVRETADKER